MTLPAGAHAFLVALLLLSGPHAWAQTALPPKREVKARQVEWWPHSSGEPLKVRVAPDFLTVLEFNAPLDPESTTVEGLGRRIALLEVNSRTIVLRLAVELAPTERLLLTVGFADGLVPARMTLVLVAHPTEVDGQLQVVRRPDTGEALQARLEAVLARCEAGGLGKLVLSGALGEGGVTVEQLRGVHSWNGLEEVPSMGLRTYRAWKLLVALVPARLPAGGPPWAPGEARLLDVEGNIVRRMPVWMDVPRLDPGGSGVIVVEMERRPEDAGKRFSLEVREKGGERGVLIQEVEL